MKKVFIFIFISSVCMFANDAFISFLKNKNGVDVSGIRVSKSDVLLHKTNLFEIFFKGLQDQKNLKIDSSSGWKVVRFGGDSDHRVITFLSPKDKELPKNLKVIVKIDQKDFRSSWHIKVDGVGMSHTITEIIFPKLVFKILPSSKLLIPKYTGKLINVEDDNIDRDMLYPCGWTSTMPFFAYYNKTLGIYLANHDPYASTKRFIVKKENNQLIYETKIIPPNKGLKNNNFKLSGLFELDLFKGDWYDASINYKNWASKEAKYWPKMTPDRYKSQHKLGEVALWAASSYISAIEYSNRSNESKLRHQKNYINELKKIITHDFAQPFKDIGVGFFWQEWYGKLHDTNFPSVFFPKDSLKAEIKSMMLELKQKYPKLQFMPYINGLLYNINLLDFKTTFIDGALKDQNGNLFIYLPRGNIDKKYPSRVFARMDPTFKPWQDVIERASSIVLNKLGADGINIDQITASAPKEDMDKKHNHPLAGGHWWRDGYDDMLKKVRNIAKNGQYITSEGANEFLSNQIDGFFVHWDGVDGMVPAYQVVYGGRVQLFGLQMRTNKYSSDIFYMLNGNSFVNGIGLGMITTWLTQDKSKSAPVAYRYMSELAWMRYHLREFLSYGTRERDINLKGNIPTISDSINDARASEEPDVINSEIMIKLPSILHSVCRDESSKKVAFIFTNISRTDSVNFSFDIDGTFYGFSSDLKLSTIKPRSNTRIVTVPNIFSKSVTLKPLESRAFIIQ